MVETRGAKGPHIPLAPRTRSHVMSSRSCRACSLHPLLPHAKGIPASWNRARSSSTCSQADERLFAAYLRQAGQHSSCQAPLRDGYSRSEARPAGRRSSIAQRRNAGMLGYLFQPVLPREQGPSSHARSPMTLSYHLRESLGKRKGREIHVIPVLGWYKTRMAGGV